MGITGSLFLSVHRLMTWTLVDVLCSCHDYLEVTNLGT